MHAWQWGGNLFGAEKFPIDVQIPALNDRIVYAPHVVSAVFVLGRERGTDRSGGLCVCVGGFGTGAAPQAD